MSHRNVFSGGVFGQCVSPYLSYLLVEAGVNDVYSAGVDLFATFLRIEVSASCVYRTTLKVGTALTDKALYETCLEPATVSEGNASTVSAITIPVTTTVTETTLPITTTETETETTTPVTYVEVDGSMLLTDDGWRETKVGRIFNASDVETLGVSAVSPRQKITQSQYCAHLGSCEDFTKKFDALLDTIPTQRLVFITDGAEWIKQWLSDKYENHVCILDYFHAVEHLAGLVKDTPYASQWLETQKGLLLENSVHEVIINVKMLSGVDSEKKNSYSIITKRMLIE
jgi:hypothetical protein